MSLWAPTTVLLSGAALPSHPWGPVPARPLTWPGCAPVSLGCRTTSASRPTTVSRPFESADTAYMVVSLEKNNNAGQRGHDRHMAGTCPHSAPTVGAVRPPSTAPQYRCRAGGNHGCVQAARGQDGREAANAFSSTGSLPGEPSHSAPRRASPACTGCWEQCGDTPALGGWGTKTPVASDAQAGTPSQSGQAHA